MNIPNENLTQYLCCSNCATEFNTNIKVFCSRYCLHKLCENCYRSFFAGKARLYKCNLCNEKGPNHEAVDFETKTQDEILYENDYKLRPIIYTKYIYKRIENFNTEEEYDDYLESIEDLIERNLGKEIGEDFTGPQSKEEMNNNIVKRDEEVNTLNKLKRQQDPNKIYNVKRNINQDNDNLMDVDITVMNNEMINPIIYETRLPVYHPNAHIAIIKNIEKQITAGGYNYDTIYSGLSKYAFDGLY